MADLSELPPESRNRIELVRAEAELDIGEKKPSDATATEYVLTVFVPIIEEALRAAREEGWTAERLRCFVEKHRDAEIDDAFDRRHPFGVDPVGFEKQINLLSLAGAYHGPHTPESFRGSFRGGVIHRISKSPVWKDYLRARQRIAGFQAEAPAQPKTDDPSKPAPTADLSRPSLTLIHQQRIADAEEALNDAFAAHEQMREIVANPGWQRPGPPTNEPTVTDWILEIRKLERDIKKCALTTLKVLAEASWQIGAVQPFRERLEAHARDVLAWVLAKVNPTDLPLLDRGDLENAVNREVSAWLQKAQREFPPPWLSGSLAELPTGLTESPNAGRPQPTVADDAREPTEQDPHPSAPPENQQQARGNPGSSAIPNVPPPEIPKQIIDAFADTSGRRPLGDNVFPPDHPGHSVFERANWKAEELISQLKTRLLETCATNGNMGPAEFVQHCLTYELGYIDVVAEQGSEIVVNEETQRNYEDWLNDLVKFRFERFLALAQLEAEGFPGGLLPYFDPPRVQMLMMSKLELYKSKGASRVRQNIQNVAEKSPEETHGPESGSGAKPPAAPDAALPAREIDAGPLQPRSKHVVGERLFRRTGDFWTLVFEGGGHVNVKNSKGMQYIAYILQCPGQSFTCIQLVAAAMGKNLPTLGSAGEVLDETAIDIYRKRIEDLESQLSEAERNGDQGRKESIQEEQEALNQQINQAFGLGGHRRSLSNDAEKLRKGVSNAIKRAIEAIRKHHPALADHFERYIERGFSVRYCSDGVDWQL